MPQVSEFIHVLVPWGTCERIIRPACYAATRLQSRAEPQLPLRWGSLITISKLTWRCFRSTFMIPGIDYQYSNVASGYKLLIEQLSLKLRLYIWSGKRPGTIILAKHHSAHLMNLRYILAQLKSRRSNHGLSNWAPYILQIRRNSVWLCSVMEMLSLAYPWATAWLRPLLEDGQDLEAVWKILAHCDSSIYHIYEASTSQPMARSAYDN